MKRKGAECEIKRRARANVMMVTIQMSMNVYSLGTIGTRKASMQQLHVAIVSMDHWTRCRCVRFFVDVRVVTPFVRF